MKNEMEIVFDAISVNESFARMTVAAFAANLNPTLEEIADIKTAVSEAVTNAIIHGYENLYGYGKHGEKKALRIWCYIPERCVFTVRWNRECYILKSSMKEREFRI